LAAAANDRRRAAIWKRLPEGPVPALDGRKELARRRRGLPEHGAGVGIDVDAAIPTERELDGRRRARPEDQAGRRRARTRRDDGQHLAERTWGCICGNAHRPQVAIDDVEHLPLEGEKHSGCRHDEDCHTGHCADEEVGPEQNPSCHGDDGPRAT
jgi:hypothetical protein